MLREERYNEYMGELLLLQNGSLSHRKRYEGFYRILVGALNQYTQECTIAFSGPFARLDYLCRQTGYKQDHPQGYSVLLSFRGRCTHLGSYADDDLARFELNDLKGLVEFLSVLYAMPVPKAIQSLLPAQYETGERQTQLDRYLRVAVSHFDNQLIYLTDTEGIDWQLPWRYEIFTRIVDLTYMSRWLQPSTMLNLVRPSRGEGHRLFAEQVIYEPDYLISISSIASCFRPYGHSPYESLIKRMQPYRQTGAILLGNFAGQMLDEEINAYLNDPQGEMPEYEVSKSRFMADNTLSLLTCADLQSDEQWAKFDADAREQQRHLRHIVRQTFAEDRTIDLSKIVLEPSFYCEMLGVQGRFDLMQTDKRVLMEQKSGKRDEYSHTHREEHYVQMLLYQAMLHYAYTDEKGSALRNDDIVSYLLYSRYEDGLLKESPAPLLLADALRLRNQLAYLDLYLCRDGQARNVLEQLTPEHLNTKQAKGRIWNDFSRPAIASVLDTIHEASPIAKDYFYRMMRFVAREQVLGKMGNSQKEASGFAALWNSSPEEKKDAGNLIDNLSIESVSDDLSQVTLLIQNDENEMLPNFRDNDIIVLYAYHRDLQPDARRDMVHRGHVVRVTADHIVVGLNAPQHNRNVYLTDDDRWLWAIEHDYMESSTAQLYRGLFALLEAPAHRRDLLLGQREPEADGTLQLAGDYGRFNPLVLKAKQARDYFLLVGPPGTGKTSCGLVNILNEQLLDPDSSVLMVSYTNRAVDEICAKLDQQQIEYLRIGHAETPMETAQLERKLRSCRVIAGTTTTLSSASSLFALRSFDLCIIDEASQILEPHLLSLLAARTAQGEVSIRKFVMIGDHKQLPAVVQQSESESEVGEERLRAIGLYNCRQSLFERLIRQSDSRFTHTLSAQGRMHQEVADFANRHFYGSLLTEVPLDHQRRPIPYHTAHSEDLMLQMLTQRRVTFLPVKKDVSDFSSDKTNREEAQLIAAIVEAVYRLYEENSLPFKPDETVGVIVPYRHQISTVRRYLQAFGIPQLMEIAIDTVERYQGSQRDVIIYGFTVSKPYQLDFLTSNVFADADGKVIDRKLNVALTRAREILCLVGDPDLLRRNPIFNELLHFIRQ